MGLKLISNSVIDSVWRARGGGKGCGVVEERRAVAGAAATEAGVSSSPNCEPGAAYRSVPRDVTPAREDAV